MFREILWPRVRRRTRPEAGAHISSKSDSTASVRSHERPPTVSKTIYGLNDLRDILPGCNRRYLEYLSSLDDFPAGIRALDHLTQPRAINGRSVRGLSSFSRVEQTRLAALQRSGFNNAGLRRADLLSLLSRHPDPTTACCSSASSNASLAPIVTISPAAAVPSLPAGASPNTLLFVP
jgi:hypothetical protein